MCKRALCVDLFGVRLSACMHITHSLSKGRVEQEALHESWRKIQRVARQYVEDLLQNLRHMDQVSPCSPNLSEVQATLQNERSEVTVRFSMSHLLSTSHA